MVEIPITRRTSRTCWLLHLVCHTGEFKAMFCCNAGRGRHYVASREFKDGCTFCRIINAPASDKCRPIFKNERLIVFPDIRPAAVRHILVVPVKHIANTDSLEPSDLDLVKEMRQVGESLLKERCKPGAQLKFGYHCPPYRSVDHLHLHCFELPHPSLTKWLKYCIPTVWLSSDALVERLYAKQQRGPSD